MKTLRYSILFLLCAFSWLSVQADNNDITITNHIWEIHKANGDTIQLPYYLLRELSFSKTDLNNVEHDDYVKQTLSLYYDPSHTNMLEDISFMKYVKKTIPYVNNGENSINCSPEGFELEINYPEGSTVSHRQNWTEIEKIGDKTIKIKARRNDGVFWRKDTIDITYPNSVLPANIAFSYSTQSNSTGQVSIEQPGNGCFKWMDFKASINSGITRKPKVEGDSQNIDDSGFDAGTGGTKECELDARTRSENGELHHYVVNYDYKDENNSIHVDVKVILNVTLNRVESAQINRSSSYEARIGETFSYRYETFKATYGEFEEANGNSYWTTQMPTSWSWSVDTNDYTETGLNDKFKGGSVQIQFLE